jgi:formylglycine-generating enzyme required for sulfatase activity
MDDEINLAVKLFRSRRIREPWLIPIKLSPCSIPEKNIGSNRTLNALNCIDLYSDWTIGIKKLLEVIRPIPKSRQSLDGAETVLVPAGEFLMGSDDDTVSKPVHRVTLIEFYMDVHPVTNAQYRRFVEETGHRKPKGYSSIVGEKELDDFDPWADSRFNADNQPVVCVNWHDAKSYAEWAQKKLPSEAQWEYAARGGMAGKLYPWGDDPPNRGLCSFWDSKDVDRIVFPGTQDESSCPSVVKIYPPNKFGLFDMVGNVWEWCEDYYSSKYYRESPTRNPRGPSWGHDRVRRGGSWADDASTLKVWYREHANAEIAANTIGFRCVAF